MDTGLQLGGPQDGAASKDKGKTHGRLGGVRTLVPVGVAVPLKTGERRAIWAVLDAEIECASNVPADSDNSSLMVSVCAGNVAAQDPDHVSKVHERAKHSIHEQADGLEVATREQWRGCMVRWEQAKLGVGNLWH